MLLSLCRSTPHSRRTALYFFTLPIANSDRITSGGIPVLLSFFTCFIVHRAGLDCVRQAFGSKAALLLPPITVGLTANNVQSTVGSKIADSIGVRIPNFREQGDWRSVQYPKEMVLPLPECPQN
ncbi:hypothetical protein B0H14DRAFT_2559615 [Mycena olivaceomarginata]|nr:hypothetical protein B0H14DRAFT_2559615 [Mycena olivaceomarginata]